MVELKNYCLSLQSRSRRSSKPYRGKYYKSYKHKYLEIFFYSQQILSISLILIFILIPNFGISGDSSFTNSESVLNTNNLESSGNDHGTSSSSSSSTTSNLEDNLRKELIKIQILQRLGLTEKPQVDLAHKISRDLVLETLRRTETLDDYENIGGGGGGGGGGSGSSLLTTNRFHHHRRHHRNSSSAHSSSSSNEDGLAYAKTSEIISFPEKGPDLNGETLLSFSFAGTNAFGVGVRVKQAHLWVKMEHRSPIGRQLGHLFHPRNVTLYVFQVQGNFVNQSRAPQFLRIQDVALEMVVSRIVPIDKLGWQKLDVTSIVQKWYSEISRHKIRHGHGSHSGATDQLGKNIKLTLLIDCNGCGYTIHPITFTRQTSASSSTSSSSSAINDHESDSINFNRTTSYLQNAAENQRKQANVSHTSRLSHAASASAFESFPDEIVDNDTPSTSSNSNSNNYDHLDNLSEIPFLVLETETSSPSVKRNRRRALECSPRVKQCCKQRFFISFAELGWQDWIIAPRGYYANYCRGHCGGAHRTPDTFLNYHTHVMEEYRRTAAGEVELNGITPCCAPTKFAAMSLIYFGPELNIIKRDLPKMIIEECGCP